MFLKRPAVLCAAAFVVGILAEQAAVVVLAAVVLCLVGVAVFIRKRKEKRQIAMVDRVLVLVPLFLLLGFLVMHRERQGYEAYQESFAQTLATGNEILAKGRVSHMTTTESGMSFELENATVCAYAAEKEVYRDVGTLLVYVSEEEVSEADVKDGQQVLLYGKGGTMNPAGNAGTFDAKQYYFSLGLTGTVNATTVRVTDTSYHRLNQALFQVKRELQKHYMTYLGREAAGVVSSMLLGERAFLSEETEELYRKGGISHILAISGLHVSLLGMTVYRLLRHSVLGRNGAIPVACGMVVLYGKFVEAGTSTKRAVLMFLLLLLGEALGRTYDTLSAMSVSAVVILWASPGALYTASFQLSYTAAYGASVLATVLSEKAKERTPKERAVWEAKKAKSRWARIGGEAVQKLKSVVLFGAAIQVVTLPFTVVHFFEYPLYGFWLNPVVVPLMTVLLFCALLSGGCGLVCSALGYFFAGGVRVVLWFYELVCKLAAKLPFSLILFGKPGWGQVSLYFLLLTGCLLFIMEEKRKREGTGKRSKRAGILCVMFLALPLCLFPLPSVPFEAAFLDVGQGDGMVLRERGGAVITVDGGSSSVQKVAEKRLIPYLKAKGIRVVDCAFLSHTDSDHMSGVKELLAVMPEYSGYRASAAGYTGEIIIRCIVLPRLKEPDASYLELVELAHAKGVEVHTLSAGEELCFGETLSFSCLAPVEGAAYADKNAASLVLMAEYGELNLLLTGDVDALGEAQILLREAFDGVSIEVLKVAHHGSHTSSSEAFVAAVKPSFAVISCGKGNRYGHPHEETLETLNRAGSQVLRTDALGCITVKAWKNGYEVYCGAGEERLKKGY